MLIAFCRDCLTPAPPAGRCPRCGSPRIARADPALHIAHVDCDAFYASVEKRDRPELLDKPLIIGGGMKRGVVSTACYIARTYGVRSAMPMARALKLCPDAVVLAPEMAKYSAVSRQIRALMEALTPLVEPVSIDEAFLDLAGCEAALGLAIAPALARFALKVEREIGVTVSIGLSYCKFLAKFASDLDKPRGFSVIAEGEAVGLLAPLSVGRLWGVGEVARQRLERLGFRRIGDLQKIDEGQALARLGDDGRRLWRLARGIDARKVSSERESKSVSAETTFIEDVGERAELEAALLGLCEKLARRLKQAELAAGGVTLKLRLPDFKLRTRARPLPPTQLAPRLFEVARALLAAQPPGERYRLIGIGTTDLRPAAEADAADLVEGDRVKEKAREKAIDALREKFGRGSVVRGLAFRGKP
ncbi:MAG: DNA polymerase IV [Pseudomonadota bacterium]|nr:DNA polymerase IV [Pseudomonadota bacterium]